jgi:hypothetical protein
MLCDFMASPLPWHWSRYGVRRMAGAPFARLTPADGRLTSQLLALTIAGSHRVAHARADKEVAQ